LRARTRKIVKPRSVAGRAMREVGTKVGQLGGIATRDERLLCVIYLYRVPR